MSISCSRYKLENSSNREILLKNFSENSFSFWKREEGEIPVVGSGEGIIMSTLISLEAGRVCTHIIFNFQVENLIQVSENILINLKMFRIWWGKGYLIILEALLGRYSETLNNEYIGRIYQMSSRQFFNEFNTILRKFQYLRK